MTSPRPLRSLVLAIVLSGCSDAVPVLAPYDGDVAAARSTTTSVLSVVPSSATRDTTLDVTINGSGFDRGSKATFELHGVSDTRVRVNSTHYVKGTQLVANVTVDATAELDFYDAVVTTSKGTKGIGTEMLEVVLSGEVLAGGNVRSVNSSGEAAGTADNPDENCKWGLPVFWSQSGTRIELPLGGFCGADTRAINDGGTMVGVVKLSSTSTDKQAALWLPTAEGFTLQLIPRPEDGMLPSPSDINDIGDVLLTRGVSSGLAVWSPATGYQMVAIPAGAERCTSYLDGINNLKAVVGACRFAGDWQPYYWPSPEAAPVALPRPPVPGGVSARAINDAGTIVGHAGEARRAFKWTPDGNGAFTVSMLPDFGGATAHTISESGVIVGATYKDASINNSIPSYWLPNGELRTLALENANESGVAVDIADTPMGIVIVGPAAGSAMLWRER